MSLILKVRLSFIHNKKIRFYRNNAKLKKNTGFCFGAVFQEISGSDTIDLKNTEFCFEAVFQEINGSKATV